MITGHLYLDFKSKIHYSTKLSRIQWNRLKAEKEIDTLKDTISIDNQEKITKLITEIRDAIQTENSTSLKSYIDNLKEAMRELVSAKVDNESNSNSVNDLNDL